jgi:hypothetical protein
MNGPGRISSRIKIVLTLVFFACTIGGISLVPACIARMTAMTDSELSQAGAGGGISVDILQSGLWIAMDSFRIEDTDHDPRHKLELNKIVIDGPAGYFLLDTPSGNPIAIDVGADASGRTIVRRVFSEYTHPIYFTVEDFRFCEQPLGSLYMDSVTQNNVALNVRAHGGVDFDYTNRLDIAALRYAYNTAPQSLTALGVHLAVSADGAPADPAAWAFTGAFKIGDISANPATMDVGADAGTGKTSMLLNLPMQGCLRVEKVTFGGNDFGPCAIDGINVHRLQVQLTPGD